MREKPLSLEFPWRRQGDKTNTYVWRNEDIKFAVQCCIAVPAVPAVLAVLHTQYINPRRVGCTVLYLAVLLLYLLYIHQVHQLFLLYLLYIHQVHQCFCCTCCTYITVHPTRLGRALVYAVPAVLLYQLYCCTSCTAVPPELWQGAD